jgi:hypothetical protein
MTARELPIERAQRHTICNNSVNVVQTYCVMSRLGAGRFENVRLKLELSA